MVDIYLRRLSLLWLLFQRIVEELNNLLGSLLLVMLPDGLSMSLGVVQNFFTLSNPLNR